MIGGDAAMHVRYRFRVIATLWRYRTVTTLEAFTIVLALPGFAVFARGVIARLNLFSSPYASWLLIGVVSMGVTAAYVTRVSSQPYRIFTAAAKSEQLTERLHRDMQKAARSPLSGPLLDSLNDLYTSDVRRLEGALPSCEIDTPVDCNGRRALVVTIHPRDSEFITDIVAETADPRTPRVPSRPDFANERQNFISSLRKSAAGSNAFGDESGLNLTMRQVFSRKGRIHLRVDSAEYGQIVRTCDALIQEFYLFLYLSTTSAFRRRPSVLRIPSNKLLHRLPWRREIHQRNGLNGVLDSPVGRHAGLGVCMVLTVRDGNGSSFLIGRRSERVGTYPGVLHVIPSGMVNLHGLLESYTPSGVVELISRTMFAEFLEEAFDMQEFSARTLDGFASRIRDELTKKGMDDMKPRFTGFAIDLLNLRPEVCALQDISAQDGFLAELQASWEYSHTEPLKIVPTSLESIMIRREDFVQAGIGALSLAKLVVEGRTHEGV